MIARLFAVLSVAAVLAGSAILWWPGLVPPPVPVPPALPVPVPPPVIRLPFPRLPAPLPPRPEPKIASPIQRILVEKAARRMTVWQAEGPRKTYDIALGFAPAAEVSSASVVS